MQGAGGQGRWNRRQKTDGGEQMPEVGMGKVEFCPIVSSNQRKKNMGNLNREETAGTGREIGCRRGKIYFSAKLERKIFFILTIVMLLLGLLAKAGLF